MQIDYKLVTVLFQLMGRT